MIIYTSNYFIAKPKALERFWSKISKTKDCWLWTAALGSKGYGQFRVNGKKKMVHRISYELIIGEIPNNLQLDHLCRVRNCINPDHLEPVTGKENIQRGINHNKIKTHCSKGHKLEGNNLYLYMRNGSMRRQCVECNREYNREKYRRKEGL